MKRNGGGGRGACAAGVTLLLVVLAGPLACETRVVHETEALGALRSGLGGSSGGTAISGGGEGARLPPIEELVVERPDGGEALIVNSIRDLMLHIGRAMEREDAELFADQILSSVTRSEFVMRGRDPEEALGMLLEHEEGVRRLFERMPVGEFTPGLYLEQVGDNVYRLRARNMPRGARYTFVDAVFEGGRWWLRWFGSGE